jgi:hypothetical protein
MPAIFTGLIDRIMAHGIIGVFFGPIVLAWALLATWLHDAKPDPGSSCSATSNTQAT